MEAVEKEAEINAEQKQIAFWIKYKQHNVKVASKFSKKIEADGDTSHNWTTFKSSVRLRTHFDWSING